MKANLPDPIDAHRLAEFLTPVSEFLTTICHRIYGLERIPPRGPALLFSTTVSRLRHVCLQPLFTVHWGDGFASGDRLMPKRHYQEPRSPSRDRRRLYDDSIELLRDNGELVAVAPGGMRALDHVKSATVQIECREGFARLAFEAQVLIILAAAPLQTTSIHSTTMSLRASSTRRCACRCLCFEVLAPLFSATNQIDPRNIDADFPTQALARPESTRATNLRIQTTS